MNLLLLSLIFPVHDTSRELKIENIEYDKTLFRLDINETEKGRKFDFSILSRPDAPLGEHREQIVFHTNISEEPVVSMEAWLKVLGRIYTNTQQLDFGELNLADIFKPDIVKLTTEMVLINGMSTPGFKVVDVKCDIDFLKVEIDPVSKNNVYRVDVYIIPEKARPGKYEGALTIVTNDKEFKEIVLPIHGALN